MDIDKDLIGKPPNVAHVINDELTANTISRLRKECDELMARNLELESACEIMRKRLMKKQLIIDIQRESFRKLEAELTEARKGKGNGQG